MSWDSFKRMGAKGKQDLPNFDPEDLILIDDPKHALYDRRVEKPIDEAFVLNILQHGVIEPVIVCADGKHMVGGEERTRMVVVAGRRRVRGARIANERLRKAAKESGEDEAELEKRLIRVSATLRRGDPLQLLGVTVSENIHRDDYTLIERAEMMQRMLNMGRSEKDLEIDFGLTPPAIKYTLRLAGLHQVVKKAVSAGQIGAVLAAKELAELPVDEQPKALAALVESGATKGAAAEEAVHEFKTNGHVAPSNGNGHDARRKKRMRSRGTIEELRKTFGSATGRDAKVAKAVLDYVLGNNRALRDFKGLAELVA